MFVWFVVHHDVTMMKPASVGASDLLDDLLSQLLLCVYFISAVEPKRFPLLSVIDVLARPLHPGQLKTI